MIHSQQLKTASYNFCSLTFLGLKLKQHLSVCSSCGNTSTIYFHNHYFIVCVLDIVCRAFYIHSMVQGDVREHCDYSGLSAMEILCFSKNETEFFTYITCRLFQRSDTTDTIFRPKFRFSKTEALQFISIDSMKDVFMMEISTCVVFQSKMVKQK